MEKEDYLPSKYIFLSIVTILIIVSFFIIKQYIVAIINAFVLAYLTKPLFNIISRKTNKTLAAAFCILAILIIIILPLGLIIGSLSKEAYNSVQEGTFQSIAQQISSNAIIKNLNIDVKVITEKFISTFISLLGNVISYIPGFLISIAVTLFGVFYMLVKWDYLSTRMKEYVPFKNKDKIIKEISEITNSIVFGTVLIGIIQFVFAFLGFYLSGASYALLLAAILGFTSFIPGIGPGAIWVPMALYYLLTSNYYTAVGIIITGLITTIYLDNLLRFKIIGEKAKINPFIMLVGIFGGVSLFGIFGFIIGPLILVYTIKLIEQSIQNR